LPSFRHVSVKRNVIANYVGQGLQSLMGFVFVPVYVKYLGIEAYGLIGAFALLQAWLGLVDAGLKPALGREVARFTAGALSVQQIRNLLRSVECVTVVIALAISAGIWTGSGWLAVHWVNPKHLSRHEVAGAFGIMGIIAALRFVEDVYVSCITGLERQVLQNVIRSSVAAARGFGTIGILALVSPTIKAFFLWQAFLSVSSLAANAGALYASLPSVSAPAHFSRAALRSVWHFAAGMVGITLLSLMLTQIDKILLSRLLTLEAFGYYALAGVLAGGLASLTAPISGAVYPRFTHLVAAGDQPSLIAVYHQGAQLVTVLVGSAAMVLIAFRDSVIMLWTGNPTVTSAVAPLLGFLALGTCFNSLMMIPYQMMLAHGWTSLSVKVNIIAVSVLVPAILWVVPRYGAIGAARLWVALNAGYIMFTIPLMHRKILRGEKWTWYGRDVVVPLAAAGLMAFVCRWLAPHGLGRVAGLVVLALTSTAVFLASAASAGTMRARLLRHLPRLRPLGGLPEPETR
jgi:O-antigen/teichoic acid export membrane protein